MKSVRADQTPIRLHTVVDAKRGATLISYDEVQTGTGNSIYSTPVPSRPSRTPAVATR